LQYYIEAQNEKNRMAVLAEKAKNNQQLMGN